MDCNRFKAWLTAPRDEHDPDQSEAMTHVAICADCRRLWQTDTVLENQLQQSFTATDVPPKLTTRMRAAIDPRLSSTSPMPSGLSWWKWVTPALATAVLLVLIFNPLVGQLTSLDLLGTYALANHQDTDQPLAVTSSHLEVVNQWFNANLPFQLAVPDLRHRGFSLKGGRPCTLGNEKAAYLIYDHLGQAVSVFVVPSRDLAFAMTDGRQYQIRDDRHQVEIWQENDMVCIVVQKAPFTPPEDV